MRKKSLQLYASQHGFSELLEDLLSHGCDVNSSDCASNIGSDSTGPIPKASLLSWASVNNHIGAVRVLLAHKANIHSTSEKGYTALTCAARYRRLDIVRVLLDAGAEVNVLTSAGKSPYESAMSEGLHLTREQIDDKLVKDEARWDIEARLAIAEMLLEEGSSIFDQSGRPVIEAALKYDMQDIVQFHLRKGLLGRDGIYKIGEKLEARTLLERAVEKNAYSVAQFLLSEGCDPFQGDEDGNNALTYANIDRLVKVLYSTS
ncbi:ankyrin repeat-containing domain protein [Aspergillus filifer]